MNNVRIELNDDAVWTEAQVKYYKDHAKSFCFTPSQAKEILGLILNGKAPKKNSDIPRAHFYEIFMDDQIAGELKFIPYGDEKEAGEIDIAIYDVFHKKGCAEKAIQKFCEITHMDKIYGLVYEDNNSKIAMNHVFEKLGFKNAEDVGVTEWCKKIERE